MTSLALLTLFTVKNYIYQLIMFKPESQHTGYGTALLNEGLSRFEDKFEGVYLEVDNKNEEAVAYYKSKVLKSYALISQKCMAKS